MCFAIFVLILVCLFICLFVCLLLFRSGVSMVETGQASDISFHSLHHLKRCPTTQDSGPQPKVHVRHTTGTMYGADQCTISSCLGSHILEKSLSYKILEFRDKVNLTQRTPSYSGVSYLFLTRSAIISLDQVGNLGSRKLMCACKYCTSDQRCDTNMHTLTCTQLMQLKHNTVLTSIFYLRSS